MNARTGIVVIALVLSTLSCRESPTAVAVQQSLELTATPSSGTAPLDVVLTGNFNAYTDTTKVFIPETFFYVMAGKPLIQYRLGDSVVAAKRVYSQTQTFTSAGTYRVCLLLQTTYGTTYSDTIEVSVH